jgi:hypothetical protein
MLRFRMDVRRDHIISADSLLNVTFELVSGRGCESVPVRPAPAEPAAWEARRPIF